MLSPDPGLRTRRLLVVEDEPLMAELIVRLARKAGCEARSVPDTRMLAEVLLNWRPQLLTLDLLMPRADGYDVLSLLKVMGYAGKLIILSGQSEAVLQQAARLAAAAGLDVAASLRKPLDLKGFTDLVRELAAETLRTDEAAQRRCH